MSNKEILKRKMILEAKELYTHIYPISHIGSFEDSFTEHKGRLLFWFNTKDNSTRTIVRGLCDGDGRGKRKRALIRAS